MNSRRSRVKITQMSLRVELTRDEITGSPGTAEEKGLSSYVRS
jgi:hypothetical protein